jgi:hypothetical protein
MTDEQKLTELSELTSQVIFALEMTQYEIDDSQQKKNVVELSDLYHAKMCTILRS